MIRIFDGGTFKIDGGTVFGVVPKITWISLLNADRQNRITLCLNCLLIESVSRTILVNTSIGSFLPAEDEDISAKYSPHPKLMKEMKDAGFGPGDIDTVILTSLRFPDAGGTIKPNRTQKLVPVFPNAEYLVQEDALREAVKPYAGAECWYRKPIVDFFQEADCLVLMKGEKEIAPGVRVVQTDGPSLGHQIVVIAIGAEKWIFPGNLIPTMHHIDPAYVASWDRDPEATRARKKEIHAMAEKGGYKVVLPYGAPGQKVVYIEQNNQGGYHIRKIQ